MYDLYFIILAHRKSAPATRCSSFYCSYVHNGQKLYRTNEYQKTEKEIQNQPVFSTKRQFQVHLNGILLWEFQDFK